MLYQRRGFLDHVDISLLENNFLPCPLSAGLFAGLLWPADDRAFAKRIEAADQDFAKAAAVGDQQRNRRNAPHDAEHGEQAPCGIALESNPSFANDFEQHKIFNWKEHEVTQRFERAISFVNLCGFCG
jgi:hypothetical protein